MSSANGGFASQCLAAGRAVKGPGAPTGEAPARQLSVGHCSRLLCAVGQLKVRQLGTREEPGSPAQAGCGPPTMHLHPREGRWIDGGTEPSSRELWGRRLAFFPPLSPSPVNPMH